MDNAKAHIGSMVHDSMEENGFYSVRLPAYSPEFNSIEHLWGLFKKNLKGLQAVRIQAGEIGE